jgi:Mg/Co/Ni transporter MgtE
MNNYYFLLLSFLVFDAYYISAYLVKIQKISQITHRRFWNIILLISFLISGTIGLILAIFIDLKLSISWYRSILWIHVETGIVMALVSFFHLFWHLPYYLSIFKKK